MVFYRDYEHEAMMLRMNELFSKKGSYEERRRSYEDCVAHLLEMSEQYGLYGDLWHSAVAFVLVNAENAFSRSCEKTGAFKDSLHTLVLSDFAWFSRLFKGSLEDLDREFGTSYAPALRNFHAGRETGHVRFNRRVRDRIQKLSEELADAKTPEAFCESVAGFYREYGVGRFGLHKAFRVTENTAGEALILPITRTEHVSLSDIIGYERQKKRLIENTEAFVSGKPANNVLLYGDAGTGKSSSIKAVMNEYFDRGLRLVELYKHQIRCLPQVIDQLKKRNYRFVIYMDDLSFEDFEIEYKYLKAVIEGGLESKPDNILIYATSNRRHLIRENTGDSKDYDTELHSSDTVQEKTSLAARFGISIYFGSPGKKDYEDIVLALAEREGIRMPGEKLLQLANQWELAHGGRSGRCARQLISYLAAQEI